MGLLYNSTPAVTGGFAETRTGSAGYLNLSQGLPFYQGRSRIASIPEYMRNPWLLGDDLVMTLEEGRSQFVKILMHYAQANGRITRPDVKYRWKIDVVPHMRFYLKEEAITSTNLVSEMELTPYTRPTQSYPTATGNPAITGDIARLQAGDYLLMMFSWLDKARTTAPVYVESYTDVIPEIARVISVNYSANTLSVERNWAGSQRTVAGTNPGTVTVVANSATPTSSEVRARDAFFIKLPNAMREDEIDQKIFSTSNTWGEGLMQRSLRAWGAGHFQEVINRNLGNGSAMDKNRRMAIKNFFNQIELQSLWGEQQEGWDAETNDWWGTTDGLLTNVPAEHYIGLVPIDYGAIRQNPTYAWGSFDIPIMNKILEDKGYYGSERKIAVCGNEAFTAFNTMINYMTQNVPDIKDEWSVRGRRFNSSGGLQVDFVQSDVMTLNGLNNKMILVDPAAFRMVNLEGYPIDIVEIANENPLKSNGFIHGVYSFLDLNPDSHWVFTIDSNLGSVTGATYATNVLGLPSV